MKLDKRYRTTAFVLAVLLVFSGCSSIVSKSNYPVAINSQPKTARYRIISSDGLTVHSGVTPEIVTLSASSGYFSSEKYTVEFEKPGYAKRSIGIRSSLDGWYLGNIAFGLGGLVGILIIDPATGAMWKLPKSVSTELMMSEKLSALETGKLHIASIDQVPEQYRNKLQRLE